MARQEEDAEGVDTHDGEGEGGEGEQEDEDEDEDEAVQEKDQTEDDTPPVWAKSKAREYLYGLIKNKKIPGKKEIKPKDVYEQYCKDRPEFKHFQDYKELKFADKLRGLRDKHETKSSRAEEDDAALIHDRKIFPEQKEDTKGRPIWAGSKAQEQLRKDIADGKHKSKDMKPRFLYATNAVYYENYDLDFFRDKIYQEEKAAKRLAWVKQKEQAKEKKKSSKNKK